jgi:soluble lytic murein transglycosylase-like protein
MRGIGRTISRLSAARAVLAGAAILAGTALRPAHGDTGSGQASHPDETAMAVPRIHPPAGSSGVGLPQPLAASEAARIRRIFALQKQGLIPAAVAETARLTDDTLLGDILADRLLAKPARATAVALSDWLGHYADLPDACAIYALLLRKLPPGAKPPPAPAAAALGGLAGPNAGAATATLSGPARAALAQGHDARALRLARDAFARSRQRDGQAAYVAGLAAWQRGYLQTATQLFQAASLAEQAGPPLRAAAAFWAARAYRRAGDTPNWRAWMLRAAAQPHTLHGMLARRALGLTLPEAPVSPILAEADVEAVAATTQGRRAFALLQVGEPARAEASLRLLWSQAQTSPALSRALFLVAGAAGLTDLVNDLSGLVDATEADLPVPALHPRGGFSLDPALVYAVAHVESNFDRNAVSGAGAHGLMQLMPVAARAIDGVRMPDRVLREPGQNLRIGQAYLAYLSRRDLAGDDLLRVLASYNAGPTAVQRWADPGTDSLLFLELMPNPETRRFVQRTLTNLWAYAARFGLQTPSLDAMVDGGWPHFSPEFRAGNPPQPAPVPTIVPVKATLH